MLLFWRMVSMSFFALSQTVCRGFGVFLPFSSYCLLMRFDHIFSFLLTLPLCQCAIFRALMLDWCNTWPAVLFFFKHVRAQPNNGVQLLEQWRKCSVGSIIAEKATASMSFFWSWPKNQFPLMTYQWNVSWIDDIHLPFPKLVPWKSVPAILSSMELL